MSNSPFRWPLAVDSFTLADKLSIAKWVLTTDRYTMGRKVEEFEARFTEFSGMYALALSSGSAANQLIFELWKVRNPGETALVICPAVTWVSSITPTLMAGFKVQFCDVNITDFSFDYDMLKRLLENAAEKGFRVIIWPTALIGFSPDMNRLRHMAKAFKADLYLDSCENTFSRLYGDGSYWTPSCKTHSILASCEMTTTSTYFSHQVTSCEGGFTFFRRGEDYDLGKMFRNHGLTRSLAAGHSVRQQIETAHPTVDPQFLFGLPGTNMRTTDVHAIFGLRDFERIEESIEHRNATYRAFYDGLDRSAYYLPPLSPTHVGFCLPIFALHTPIAVVKEMLLGRGIEVRPIVGGNLLHQPIFNGYGSPTAFPNAEWIHTHGCYVGLHQDVSVEMVDELTALLNGLALRAAA